ncbi:hypothetical protein F4859DRAFT_505903 [Xylaria cf. heliscus]|nr:hypothetical protein F4859DRAFT_505903 [Xylaria cf. heliscus]
MAQPPGQRALILNAFFAREHGFEPETYTAGIICYKRPNPLGGAERIVVKHAVAAANPGVGRDNELEDEERLLRRLWGAEHICRLLAIVDNRHHRSQKWNEPLNRVLHDPSSVLPWKLTVDPIRYLGATRFYFFVMEHLARGDGGSLIERCQAMAIPEISEPVLWYFFLCLTRACAAMSWPPNRRNLNPPPVVREEIPNPMQRASRTIHGDLHLGNIMFGDYDVGNMQPACHQGVPIIDFGLAGHEATPKEAQQDNIRYVAELIRQIALVEEDELVWDWGRDTFLVNDIPSLGNFQTYLAEDFYRSNRFTKPFTQLLAWCMAEDQNRRPSVKRGLRICERNVARTPNWRHLADEVNEIFDMVPLDMDDSSGSEYQPPSSSSSDSN